MDLSIIPVSEARKRLEGASYYWEIDSNLKLYASYLAKRLDNKIDSPRRFYQTAYLVLFDLKRGVSSDRLVSIPRELLRLPEEIYDFLESNIDYLAEIAFSKDFVKEMHDDLEAMHKNFRKQKV